MTNPLIIESGLALWGPSWQTPMARETGHNIRTIQGWAAGRHKPRAKVYAELLALMAARVSNLGSLMQRLQEAKP